ncbi:MAG: hypothetical protein HETSPECPRED_000541 [Heterodermia speciosa]|uniref:Uncharacterized protein n=1 Tax=Heterodermia speciosa TaxID=116794 RepID=A0A8H3IZR9_9LECA|nr:MAG: hypothetical protein HETSPECPRED_000541 [Heterodermia speciosa]
MSSSRDPRDRSGRPNVTVLTSDQYRPATPLPSRESVKDTETDWLSAFEAKEIEDLRQWYEENAQAQRDAEEQQLVNASRTRREAYDGLREILRSLSLDKFGPATSVWKTREEQRAAAIK